MLLHLIGDAQKNRTGPEGPTRFFCSLHAVVIVKNDISKTAVYGGKQN